MKFPLPSLFRVAFANSASSAVLLTVGQVCDRLTISEATLRRYAKQQADFPRKVQLGPRRVAYAREEVEAWVKSRYEAAESAIGR